MSATMQGGLLGLVLAIGLGLVIRYSPPLRRPRLADRLAPYLSDTPRPSRLLAPGSAAGPYSAAGQLLRPVLADAARAIERIVGGSRSVRRRLAGMGSRLTVEEFRAEQVIWGFGGVLAGVMLGLALSASRGPVNPIAAILCAFSGGIAGIVGRDWLLTSQLRRREERMLAELPVVAELLALAVTAGETAPAALARVCAASQGEVARELQAALTETRAGTPIALALTSASERTTLAPLARFLDGIVIALERGTPIGDVLRAQAADVREAGKRALLASGGRREIAMMVPVVFLILPVTVLFALYPGLVNISMLTR
ncbi:MAG: Type secretion system domain protein [Actinomycetia bacterium]|nr:Type secretion system domain protein [Actinomycetes bacterium]MDQ1659216.1 tight adherence protein [Cryptosporangiaceae bacterium]